MRTVLVAWLLLMSVAPAAWAETLDRVLAVAAGQLILLSDVTTARDLGLVPLEATAPDPIGELLSKLIERKLILAEVERYAPPEPGADAVDREVAGVRARFPSRPAFDAALSILGIDENHLRETLREDLRIRAYEDQRFTVPPPTDEEIGLYYREHAATFTRDGLLVAFEAARPEIVRQLSDERRKALTADWVAGLRRRADVIDLYLPGR